MARKIRSSTGVIDCACVIHSTGYEWQYVERLYNMLTRWLPGGIRFHVYTEHDRSVPPHMIKHCLDDLPIQGGPKRSWWYKMQLFNSQHHSGPLLYLDLDVVIVKDISWIASLPTTHLWGCRDFRYLQNPNKITLNSSVMWWNTADFAWVWQQFVTSNVSQTVRRFPGDQDYLAQELGPNRIRYLNERAIKSWRWQCINGGYDFARRQHRQPGTGTHIDDDTSIVVFHGHPKPHETRDAVIQQLWQ